MSMWWSLHLRREAASVPLARRFLLGAMETAGVDPEISFDLSVALTEACANAVEHGGDHRAEGEQSAGRDPWDAWDERPGTACGRYRVTAYLDGEKCRIEVADSGPGFPARRAPHASAQQHDPQQHPPLGAEDGRGLCLIEQLADHVHFGNRPGRGAVVSFDKVLKWRKGALLMVS
ncbi:ATP-binding protein [Streptomyces sp. NBC_01217]|uniref:ATP-binding protein n=1 Tax=Streptomyces sp. NBC_01217 TaxID=2903779 RepID=UPI002E1239C4|nr:ATP-binding protein [Streptomyces sp. NBC_01217]